METLVVVAQHRNHGFRRSKAQICSQFDTSPSRGFKDINSWSVQSGFGILRSPPPVFPSYGSTFEPRSSGCRSEPPKVSRKTNPITISPKPFAKYSAFCNDNDISFSELWAGPAYSNSPPPSSLPIPKFSLHQRRSVSLDPPGLESDIVLQPEAKSAPSSPVRNSSLSPSADFFLSTASATKNLRRILNLDLEY